VGYRRELGDSRSIEDGMVGSFEVCNLELDVLGAVVLPSLPEGNCWAYTPGTARKVEDGLLLEFPCNPTRTRFV
jgi:hypothetical protein